MTAVTLTMTFASEAEAVTFLSGKYLGGTLPPQTEAAKPTKPAATAASAPSPSPAVAAPTPAAPAAAPTPPAGDAPDEGAYKKSGIPERIQKLVAKDRAAAVALLGEFGVKKGGELKVSQFEAFAARADALLADSLT